MTFRVTQNSFASQAIHSARARTASLARLQQQVSTGLRLLRPSDDPADMRRLLAHRADDERYEVTLANIQNARTNLNAGVSQLLEASNVFVRAKQLALEGNQLSDPVELETLADEVDTLLNRLLAIANTENGGTYLFGGAATDAKPFGFDGVPPAAVSYAGSRLRSTGNVGAAGSLDVYFSGEEIFLRGGTRETVVFGTTGAAPGTGTDNGRGFATLSVVHATTTYAGASGVQSGTGSAAGDNIIGPAGAHILTVNDTSGTGASGTVSLNGGAPVAFTDTDTNLAVPGPEGAVVYVDTTNITAGFSGNVDITADGSLSVDGGATSTAIDFTANQIVVDSATGHVTNIDSTAIRTVGSDRIEYAGSANAFETLIQLRDDLRNTRSLSSSDWHDSIARRIGEVDRVRERVMSFVGEQSASLEGLEALERRAADLQLQTREAISQLESADAVEVVTRMQEEQTLLQFTFAASGQLLDLNLLNFLR